MKAEQIKTKTEQYSDLDYPPNRRIVSDWVHPQPLPKPHFERRPPLSPPRGRRWKRHSRERSRSPPLRDGPPPHQIRRGPPPLRDYRRNSYFDKCGDRDMI
uniref:Uncharacterized protein n=1 Tax=Brassica campestris TaxID=3711 RepID=M4E5W8_BRACM